MSEDYFDLISNRYSVRKFKNERLSEEVINKILEAGLKAPTACNKQPYKVLVMNDDESISLLRKCTECHFNCPTAMLICYDKSECWVRPYDNVNSGQIDASIVTTTMMYAAWECNVGTTWVMFFIEEAFRCEFNLPDNLVPVSLLVMGYPSDDCKPYPNHFKSKSVKDIKL